MGAVREAIGDRRPASRTGIAVERLLTIREVAQLLGVHASWVYDHVRPGCGDPLPYIKLGKYLRFRLPDILDYLDAATRKSSK